MTRLLSIQSLSASFVGCFLGLGLSGQVDSLNFSKVDTNLKSISPALDSLGLCMDDYLKFNGQFNWSSALPSSGFNGGEISLLYQYGFPTDMNVFRNTTGSAIVHGNVLFQPIGVPMKMEGNYNQFSLRPESENYFRFSFDRNAFKEQMKSKREECLGSIDSAKKDLTGLKRDSKIEFASFNYALFDEGYSLPGMDEFTGIEDYDDFVTGLPSTQSVPGNFESPVISEIVPNDNLVAPNMVSDSTISQEALLDQNIDQDRMDSLLRGAGQAKLRISNLNEEIDKLERYEQMVKSGREIPTIPGVSKGFREKLQYVQKFQLGQTNPSFSEFMLAQVPVNGVTIQYESPTREFNFTHGQIVAPVWAPLNQRQSVMRNLIGDVIPAWNNIGDRVTAGTWAIKKTKELEVHFGGLFGLDKFLESGLSNQERSILPSRNGVGELVVLWKPLSGHEFMFGYGQSFFVDSRKDSEASENSQLNGIRGNAFKLGWKGAWPKLNLETKFEWTRVDPMFKSLGNPYLREDQSRLSGTLIKRFKKFNLSITGREQHNNLLKTEAISTSLYNLIGNIQIKCSKRLMAGFQYIPIRVLNRNNMEGSGHSAHIDPHFSHNLTPMLAF